MIERITTNCHLEYLRHDSFCSSCARARGATPNYGPYSYPKETAILDIVRIVKQATSPESREEPQSWVSQCYVTTFAKEAVRSQHRNRK